MKYLIFISLMFANTFLFAQEIKKQQQFTVEGKVNHALVFNFRDTAKYTSAAVDSLVVYNHLMERRKTLKDIKGVLLRDVISAAGIAMDKPKLLSEFYITCIAVDGYKVTFSWNELYNTAVGKKVMLITSINGKNAAEMNDGVTLVSAADDATGRRLVYNLAKVIVSRAE